MILIHVSQKKKINNSSMEFNYSLKSSNIYHTISFLDIHDMFYKCHEIYF